jgi:hypothetical protein
MGKIKQALIEFEEQSYAQFKRSPKGEVLNQQDWAQYEAEFNAWLDAYEQSFGTREDLS